MTLCENCPHNLGYTATGGVRCKKRGTRRRPSTKWCVVVMPKPVKGKTGKE